MGNELGPVFAAGRGDGRGDEAEVAAAVVGADEPEAVAVIDGVLVLVVARADEGEAAVGLVGGEDAGLGGGVAGGFHDEEFAVAGAADAEVEALVVVLVDEDVGGVRRAEGVTPELELALLLLVFDGVEEGAIVGGPDDGADALDFAGQGFAGFEILDVEGVLAEAGGVGGVGEPAAVVGDVGVADGEEGVAFGELVAVEDDLLGGVGVMRFPGFRLETWGTRSLFRRRLAAVDGVLVALFGAGVVPPVAVAVGDGDVGLLHVGEHLAGRARRGGRRGAP